MRQGECNSSRLSHAFPQVFARRKVYGAFFTCRKARYLGKGGRTGFGSQVSVLISHRRANGGRSYENRWGRGCGARTCEEKRRIDSMTLRNWRRCTRVSHSVGLMHQRAQRDGMEAERKDIERCDWVRGVLEVTSSAWKCDFGGLEGN